MNKQGYLHDDLNFFDVLTVVAIIVGLTLVFAFFFAALNAEAFASVETALNVFDVSATLPSDIELALFPFAAMGEFYEQFYVALADIASVPAGSLAAYSELMAQGYLHVAYAEQQSYSGSILGAVVAASAAAAPDAAPQEAGEEALESGYTAPNLSELFSKLHEGLQR